METLQRCRETPWIPLVGLGGDGGGAGRVLTIPPHLGGEGEVGQAPRQGPSGEPGLHAATIITPFICTRPCVCVCARSPLCVMMAISMEEPDKKALE